MADALRTVYGHEAGMRRGCLLGVALGDDSALLRVKSLREAASRAMLEVSDAAGKDSMRLVTWNCAGKFREKFELVSRLEADLYVIQECEDPQVCRHEAYREFASHGLWTGEKPYKGLGIFARNGTSLSRLDWEPYCLRHFLPVRVNDSWNLLGVWAAKPHIEEYYVYHCIHRDKMDERTVVIGDFNSNQRWDTKHNARSHSAVVRMMAEAGLVSAWHAAHGEEQGRESVPTFYLYRRADRPYHIDYAFVAPQRLLSCEIVQDECFACSDHRPLVVDITL